jgi:hypothetical protein
VFLDLGSDAFYKNDWQYSSRYYQLAERSLRKTGFATRPKILWAISVFNFGDYEDGLFTLEDVIRDKSADKNLRAEAIYRYVCCVSKIGHVNKINRIVQYSKGLDMSAEWQKRLDMEL